MGRIVKKILKILLIAVIFAVAALPALYTNSVYGYLPASVLLLAVIISLVCMLIVRKSIRISSDFAGNECQRGSSVTIMLHVENSGLIMGPRAQANIIVTDLFGENDSEMQTTLTLAPKADNKLGFDMDMPHIGVYEIGIDSMKLYDLFGIFKSNVDINGRTEVYVMPRIFPVEELVNNELEKDESPRDRSTAVVGGSDYMGTREYTVGDSMKNIHWKQSSKAQGYMTKVYESSKEMDFSVILDFTSEKLDSRETAMDIYDSIIETGLSIIDEIARVYTSYFLIYADKNNVIKKMTPKGRDDDRNLIKDFSVIVENPAPEVPDAYSILEEGGKMSSRSSNVIVVTSRITEDLVQEIVRVKRQGRTPELYIVVPSGLTKREIDDMKGRLSQLDESNIYFNFVRTGLHEDFR